MEVISLPGSAQAAVTVTHYDGPRQDWTEDARGYRTSFEYDDLGRVVKTIHPATSYKVVGTGNAIQSASGPVYSHVGYDGFGRKAWETPGPVSFESAGDIPANQRKWYSYDVGGRLTKVKMPAVDSAGVCPVYRYFYDAYGNQIAIVDLLGRVTRLKYNELNLLTQQYQPFVPDPALSDDATAADVVALSLNGILYESTEYDTNGRISRQTDCKGQVTIYEYYDATDYQSGSEFFGRPGQLKWKQYYTSSPSDPTHWNSRTVYLYDRLGRDKSQAIQDSWSNPTVVTTSTSNAYDEEGRITRILSTEGDIHYVYSPLTGLKTATWTGTNIETATTKTDYTYDDFGRLSTVDVTRRNGAAVTENATAYTYNDNGSQETVAYSNGNEAVYEYDALNRLSRLTNFKNSNHVETELLSRFEYSCYANGQRATAVETRTGWQWTGSTNIQYGHPTRQIAYQYDGMGRLKREQRNGNDPNLFAYDLVGNRVSQVIGNRVDGSGIDDNETTVYSYNDRDQLYQDVLQGNGLNRTITYQYDANGSLTSQTQGSDTTTYGYDLRNRLTSVTVGSTVTNYGYNPDGIRVRKQVGTGTPTVYLIDPMNPTGYSQVLQETTGSTVTSYILGADVIGQATGSTPIYLLYDGHGSVRNHAKPDGALEWFDIPGLTYDGSDGPTDQDYTLYTYDAWGKECRRQTTEGLYYSGEMYDQNLAMYNLRARYYNPANGRFNATDPYSGSSHDPQSLHKYLYCHGDPVNGIDPSGNMTLCQVASVTAIAGFVGSIFMPGLHHLREQNKDIADDVHRADGISFLEEEVKIQRRRDILETDNPDELGMRMQFYRDLGNGQKIVTYSTLQLEQRALWTIDSAIHGAQIANTGLVIGGTVAGSNFAQIVWCKPHGGDSHWASLIKYATNQAATGKADIIYTNRGLSTITQGQVKVRLFPDVAEVMPSGKLRITQFMYSETPTQAAATEERFRSALEPLGLLESYKKIRVP